VSKPKSLSKTDIEGLKSRISILAAARALGLEVRHNRIRCPNPQGHAHGDRTPSVTLWPERGYFKCWVCPEVKGDVIDLVRLVRNCGFTEAVAWLENTGPAGTSSAARAQGGHFRVPASPGSQTELFRGTADSLRPFPPAPETGFSPEPKYKDWAPSAEARRRECVAALLELCGPVNAKASAWLRKRRIFKKTWEAQGLRMVADYGRMGRELAARFSPEQLRESGLFNAQGHLRFYRHPLLLPYHDVQGRAVYVQARALSPEVKPKELSLAGPIPCPYNARRLDGAPGPLYLCEGAIDTLTLIEAGFPAVGIPGARNFKSVWVPLFRNKSVYIAFDADPAGEAGAAKTLALLAAEGVEAHRLEIPPGKDINEWLGGKIG